MIGSRWRRRNREGGATLVEFAFVAPVLFLMLGAMLDIGLIVLGTSVASGAARDGARVGIINYLNADNPASSNYTLVKNAVQSKLVGLIRPASDGVIVSVRCVSGGTETTKACGSTIQVDFDQIEVTVRWQGISATGAFITPGNRTNKAKMVITGGGTAGTVIPPVSSGNFTWDATSINKSVAEGNSSNDITLRINRQVSTSFASVNYQSSGGSATAGNDYTAVNAIAIFGAGVPFVDIPITLLGDTTNEPNETFNVTLSGPVNGTVGSPPATTVTLTNDDAPADTTPPTWTLLQMRDIDFDGKVDQVTVTFNEPLQPTCNTPSAFTFSGAPSGGTPGAVSITSPTVTLTVNEGTDAPDTAVDRPASLPARNFRISLATDCVKDTTGNSATFTSQKPTDFARPALVAVTDTNVGTDGKPENNDTLVLVFSEVLVSPPTLTNVVITETKSNQVGQLSMSGIIITTNLNTTIGGYASKDLTFNNSTVAATNAVTATSAGTTLTVTLKNCSSSPSCSSNAAVGSSSTLTIAPASSLNDGLTNGASGSVTKGTLAPPPAVPFKLF